jgi:hypothetical protein
MDRIVFEDVRGLEGIKESTLHITPDPTSPFNAFAGTPHSLLVHSC